MKGEKKANPPSLISVFGFGNGLFCPASALFRQNPPGTPERLAEAEFLALDGAVRPSRLFFQHRIPLYSVSLYDIGKEVVSLFSLLRLDLFDSHNP